MISVNTRFDHDTQAKGLNIIEEKEELVKRVLCDNPEFTRDKVVHAIERCYQIIPPPRHKTAFFQTVNWYLRLL